MIQEKFVSQPVSFDALSGWQDDNHAQALTAFIQSCGVLGKAPRPQTSQSKIRLNAAQWSAVCKQAKQASPASARVFFEQHFTPYRISNHSNEQGLFTGYYEPLLYGALKKVGRYIHPVYALPEGKTQDEVFYTRSEIERGAMTGKAQVLAWVDDPIMLFFMHVQGSGRVQLEDGRQIRLAYAGHNGHDYVGVGKLMKDRGILPAGEVNFFTMREYMRANPAHAAALIEENPRYIFFTINPQQEVIGAAKSPLTPRRSLAVDERYIPYGLPLYLETTLPEKPGRTSTAFHRLMVAQDTGSAIKGPVRGDIFFGAGDEAQYDAGLMANQGRYTLLVPNVIADQMRDGR